MGLGDKEGSKRLELDPVGLTDIVLSRRGSDVHPG